MDLFFLARPNAHRVQLDLFYDYQTNAALYPTWQAFLREKQPLTLILWGQEDIFFTPEGGEAYLRDLPDAELVRLDSGHFAVEDCLDQITASDPALLRHQGAPRRLRVGGCGLSWARRPATSSPSAARPGSTSTALPGQSSSPPAAASSPW